MMLITPSKLQGQSQAKSALQSQLTEAKAQCKSLEERCKKLENDKTSLSIWILLQSFWFQVQEMSKNSSYSKIEIFWRKSILKSPSKGSFRICMSANSKFVNTSKAKLSIWWFKINQIRANILEKIIKNCKSLIFKVIFLPQNQLIPSSNIFFNT